MRISALLSVVFIPDMSKSKGSNSTDTEFDDISSFSSIDSYKPQPFTGFENGEEQGQGQLQEQGDLVSRASTNTLSKPDSNAIEKVVTHNALSGNVETKESLQKEGLNLKDKSVPDINAPLTSTSETAAFPEEYRIETQTGLVKLKTLNDLSRKDTRVSIGSNDKISRKSTDKGNHSIKSGQESGQDEVLSSHSSYDPHNLENAIEKNKHEIEKYQKHKHEKGIKGFVHRLFD